MSEASGTIEGNELAAAAGALTAGRLTQAEALLRRHLSALPGDPPALRMLANLGMRLGLYAQAEGLLAHCLSADPADKAAREAYASALHRQGKAREALQQAEQLLADDPANRRLRTLQASALRRLGEFAKALAVIEALVEEDQEAAPAWLSYGHALKAVGRTVEAVGAYRRAIALRPAYGEAWWSLANLKTTTFGPEDMTAMQRGLDAPGSEADVVQLHFALGRANETAGRYAASFAHYAQGNRLARARLPYDADANRRRMRRAKAEAPASLFAGREAGGCQAADPIFIVGLPRSGSTLVEQMLASHPAVEGSMELPDLAIVAAGLQGRALGDLGEEERLALGESYLRRTRVYRKTGRGRFIDKMPHNFWRVGLIHLILPRATIIDVRRDAMACGFSCFKQYFAMGCEFSYDLADIGRYYADYIELMDHFDAVLPGRVHRLVYEDLVAAPEAALRRLLDHCGLPFDPACPAFHDNPRPVLSASSEQVRQPLSSQAVEHWRHYEPWLGPLRAAAGGNGS